ncbi:MAG: winged helix-turn-helix transcriptional regulator [Mariprofundaceae bacterium]|nr:winged helix-turn-helix transcriptional regulator [Mariprofundaceae bacterium]
MSENISLTYKIFKLIDHNPSMKQREFADTLGLSLGKMNYCLKALVEKGFVKAGNFRNSEDSLLIPMVNTRAIALKNVCFIIFASIFYYVLPECVYRASIELIDSR